MFFGMMTNLKLKSIRKVRGWHRGLFFMFICDFFFKY